MIDRPQLDAIASAVEGPERLAADPLGLVPRDAPPAAQELVAFLAAGLAFGNVVAIKKSVQRVVAHLGRLDQLGREGHRWVRGDDLRVLVGRLTDLQGRHGSLGAAFMDGYVPGDMRRSLSTFAARLRDGLAPTRGIVSLTSSPDGGSACKRLNLFMRWMVRQGGPDLGLWRDVAPRDLVVPLDVHVTRFARRYGLTRRRTVDWRMAEEVTEGLRRLVPEDPLRYDFAISHHGMTVGW